MSTSRLQRHFLELMSTIGLHYKSVFKHFIDILFFLNNMIIYLQHDLFSVSHELGYLLDTDLWYLIAEVRTEVVAEDVCGQIIDDRECNSSAGNGIHF